MIILHVLEPFATGTTTAVNAITRGVPDFTHIVIHGSRNWTRNTEKVKNSFPPGVSFIEWKNAGREISPVNDWKALRSLIKILKPYAKQKKESRNPFVVHLHSSKAGFLGRLACRILGIKTVVYTPHCGSFLRTDIGFFKRKLYYFLEWLGGCFGGRVVGCGPSEGEIYKKLGKNITYVSNGVTIREAVDQKTKRDLISFTGLASLQKDPSLWSAIAFGSTTTAAEYGFSFCWIGDGPEAEKLKQDFIILTGWKNEDEVAELHKNTAVFFSASAWEGLPYGVLEAMSSGCALLLRNIPGHRDLVIPGENGWLFDTREEAINRLDEMIKDRTLLSEMGKRSIEIVKQRFSLKQMGEGYREIYCQTGAIR